jgi:hypothetical protein
MEEMKTMNQAKKDGELKELTDTNENQKWYYKR